MAANGRPVVLFGVEGMADRVREHVRLARGLVERIDADPDWQVMAPAHFSLVTCRYQPDGVDPARADSYNEQIVERINATGKLYLSATKHDERYVIRIALGNLRQQERHVLACWDALRDTAREVNAAHR